MAHTIKGCKSCGNDYMHHNDETQFNEICQDCYDTTCLVLHDLQSEDKVSIVTEYDYLKHKIGNPIFYKGTRTECEEWRKNNTPLPDNIQDILSSIALEDINNWDVAHLFKNVNALKKKEDRENHYLAVTNCYWRAEKILKMLAYMKREALKINNDEEYYVSISLDVNKYKKLTLDEIEELTKSINAI
jgi:hypothetical protein